VRAVRDWIDFSLLSEGPLFRPVNRFRKIRSSRLTDQSVALIVKRWALKAGFDPMLLPVTPSARGSPRRQRRPARASARSTVVRR
jgi:hypothetical protein